MVMETHNVTLRTLAIELGIDRSHLRKFVLQHGIIPIRVRTVESNNQATLAIRPEDAAKVRQLRADMGFTANGQPEARVLKTALADTGFFYVIVLDPELRPNRVKLGFTNDLSARLMDYHTANPEAELVTFMPCRRSWEPAWLALLTGRCSRNVGGEVYDVDDLEALEADLKLLTLMAGSNTDLLAEINT